MSRLIAVYENTASTTNIVTTDISLNDTAVTPGSGSVTSLDSGADIPSNLRPATAKIIPAFIRNNGADITTPGALIINSSGVVNIRRDITSTAYTSSAVGGLTGSISVSFMA